MKIIAMYLPQFHPIKENDEWWGKGFTEWTAVRNAKPLFEGHNQPEVPLNNNYYDLMKKDVMEWQAGLATEYSIDGFCMYHYWFKNGRRILEKPAENLLRWKDIKIQYCFAWDTTPWVRSWSALIGNVWSDVLKENDDKGNVKNKMSQYLLEQDYGGDKEWEEHFYYLLEFFKDERYLRVDGKPVFYFCSAITNPYYERMVYNWQVLAKQNGLLGLYIINQINSSPMTNAIAKVMNPAMVPVMEKFKTNEMQVCSYEKNWEYFLQIPHALDKTTIWEVMVSYDDTPRRGKRANILLGASPERFEKYLNEIVKKAKKEGSPVLFLNAWNEWGEGMHLEPDERFGYGWLEVVRKVLSVEEKTEVDCKDCTIFYWQHYAKKLENDLRKKYTHYLFMRDWVKMHESHSTISEFLWERGFRNISIYGLGTHAKMLLDELNGGSVNVLFAIDKAGKHVQRRWNKDIPIMSWGDDWPECDMVVVCVIDSYIEILEVIRDKCQCPIVSLHEIVARAGGIRW